jgi:hypothetical protein
MIVFITMRSGSATCPRARAFESGPEVPHCDSSAAEEGGSVFASRPGSFLVSAEGLKCVRGGTHGPHLDPGIGPLMPYRLLEDQLGDS